MVVLCNEEGKCCHSSDLFNWCLTHKKWEKIVVHITPVCKGKITRRADLHQLSGKCLHAKEYFFKVKMRGISVYSNICCYFLHNQV